MAHKKGQGSSRNGRDSQSQRRGVKVYGGQSIAAGSLYAGMIAGAIPFLIGTVALGTATVTMAVTGAHEARRNSRTV